ncbi:TPA: single-stranded DNA-binding protein, partial [Vibrio cholerae O1]
QKGAKLFVQGPQRTRSWEKDGIKHRLTEVDADEFLLLDSVNKASEPSATDDAGSQTNWAQTYPEPDF